MHKKIRVEIRIDKIILFIENPSIIYFKVARTQLDRQKTSNNYALIRGLKYQDVSQFLRETDGFVRIYIPFLWN